MRLPFLLFACLMERESCVCEESAYSTLSWRQPKWHWVLRCGQKVGGETFDSISKQWHLYLCQHAHQSSLPFKLLPDFTVCTSVSLYFKWIRAIDLLSH